MFIALFSSLLAVSEAFSIMSVLPSRTIMPSHTSTSLLSTAKITSTAATSSGSNSLCMSVNANTNTNTNANLSPQSQIKQTSTKTVYAVNLKFSIKPERREDFFSLIKDNQKKTLDLEPAALQYVVGEDTETPNTFYIHEEFIGAEGFDAHRTMPHNANWAKFKDSNPFCEGGEPTLDFYYEYSSDTLSSPEKIPIRPAFGVHVELYVKPDFREEFLTVIENNQKGSNGEEPLCLQYVFGESTSEENKFVFHEEYDGADGGKEGFDAHTQTKHFVKWEEFVEKDPFTKAPVVNFFRTI